MRKNKGKTMKEKYANQKGRMKTIEEETSKEKDVTRKNVRNRR